jgi:hypothetical protein
MDCGNLFHVAWQGNFETWVTNPLKPIAHAIWDPHFGESAIKHLVKVRILLILHTLCIPLVVHDRI